MAIVPVITCVAFGIVATLISYFASGARLGLLFAPLLLATLFTPPLLLAGHSSWGILQWLAIVLAIAGVWLFTSGLLVSEWAACTFVLAAYLSALAAVALLLVRFIIPPILASASTVLLGLAWLTWPVWLSRALTGRGGEKIVAWLTAAHPLLAINGVVQHRFDAWDRYRLAYQQLTTLNQDVFYHLPRSVIPAVLLHAAIGIACGILIGLPKRTLPRSQP
jgi:hypothetical protein